MATPTRPVPLEGFTLEASAVAVLVFTAALRIVVSPVVVTVAGPAPPLTNAVLLPVTIAVKAKAPAMLTAPPLVVALPLVRLVGLLPLELDPPWLAFAIDPAVTVVAASRSRVCAVTVVPLPWIDARVTGTATAIAMPAPADAGAASAVAVARMTLVALMVRTPTT